MRERARESDLESSKKRKRREDKDRSGIHVWWRKNKRKKKNIWMKLRKEK